MNDQSQIGISILKHWKWTIAYGIAAVLILVAAILAGQTLADKGKENESFAAYSSIEGFYLEPQKSLDTIFLGTSAAYCGCVSRVYEEETRSAAPPTEGDENGSSDEGTFGKKAWNLGSSQQSLLTSYWWLREARESGKLKPGSTVYLEMFYAFYPVGNEGSLHKAFDWMKMSPLKVAATSDLVKTFPEYRQIDFLLPTLRYHDRWTELTVDDLAPYELTRKNNLYRGYCPRDEVVYEPFVTLPSRESEVDSTGNGGSGNEIQKREALLHPETTLNPSDFANDAPQELTGIPLEYLEKIRLYCLNQGLHLVLVKTPTTEWTLAQHNAVEEYANDRSLYFVDFNMENLYEAANYDFSTCKADHMHANTRGAALLTKYLTSLE